MAQLVVTDLDGTLWERDAAVHERTRAALGLVAAAGLPVLVATGRRVGSARKALAALGLAPPAVVLNGGLGLDLGSGERFHRRGFAGAEAMAVLEVFVASGIEPCVYVDHDDQPVWVGPAPSTHPRHLASFGSDVSAGRLEDIVASEHVLAFGVLGLPAEVARRIGAALLAVASPHVDRDRAYGGHSVTVAPARQSKWDGVLAFCDRHQLDPGQVLAIGDGANDVELLANAATAVTPRDAHPAALAVADHIVGRAAAGGWADILELLGLH